MDSNDTGFFFGVAPESGGASGGGTPPGPNDEVFETAEVSGEPVSRSEAKKMGVVDYNTASRQGKPRVRPEGLPADVKPDTVRKIEQALTHLKRNETQEALALAQEAVWEYPTLVAAKIIIARCFINRKEFDKSLALLQAIPDGEKTAECYYYIGLCQSRLGRIKEAIDALRLTRANATDAQLRKRATELLSRMQSAATTCPSCGRKVPYTSMVEVDGQLVCSNCAKAGGNEDDFDDGEDGDVPGYSGKRGKRRRKKLKPPLSKTDILVRAVFALMLAVLLYLGIYAFYLVAPGPYATFRSFFPDAWTWLPRAQPQGPSVGNSGGGVRPPPVEESGPRVIDSLPWELPPITAAVVGVEVRHRLNIEGMEKRAGEYSADFVPMTAGEWSLDAHTGDFAWTPSKEEAGEVVAVTFKAVFGDIAAPDQVNQVRVSSGPVFRNLGVWEAAHPNSAQFILAEDLAGDAHPEVLMIAGDYWRGNITLLGESPDGSMASLAQSDATFRPAGAGVIMAGQEKWIGIADYMTSRLRFFTVRDRQIAEMATTVELPGRPVLAAFDRSASFSAALCETNGTFKVVGYIQEGQVQTHRAGEWQVPDDVIWRKMFVTRLAEDEQPMIVLVGADFSNSILMMQPGNSGNTTIVRHGQAGVLVDAALSPDGRKLYCLVNKKGALSLETVELVDYPEEGKYPSVPVTENPSLCGIGAADLLGSGEAVVVMSTAKAGIAFGGVEKIVNQVRYWPLPAPGRLYGSLVRLPGRESPGDRFVFVDGEGGVWMMEMAF